VAIQQLASQHDFMSLMTTIKDSEVAAANIEQQ
jgi:hypothetical protein